MSFFGFFKEENQPMLLVLPYVRGLGERIQHTVSPLNSKAVFDTVYHKI